METIVWIAQGLLATAFLAAGSMKLMKSHAQLLEMGDNMKWVEDFDPWHIKSIATAEVLGAIGLILPAALDIAPVLTPIAALGLGLTMLGAAATHVRRGELQALPANVVLLALATFVAIERFGPHAL
jgi:uncharacterized membrane protein YphA (DoxX/SURF4 family)